MDFELPNRGIAGYEYINAGAALCANQVAAKQLAAERREPTLRERVLAQKEAAEREMNRLDELSDLLERNPDVSRILALMGYHGY